MVTHKRIRGGIILKKITSFMIFVFIMCISVVAGADSTITDYDWSSLEKGNPYTPTQLNIANVTFGTNSEIVINDDGSLSLGTVKGKAGGSIRFTTPNPVTEGNIAFDVKLKKEGSNHGWTGRNVLRFGTADKQYQALVLYTDGSIRANVYDDITASGNFPLTSSGRNGSYTTDNEYYDLRMLFSRETENDDWYIRVYDKQFSTTQHFYEQTVPADKLSELSTVAFEVYKQKTEDEESVITVKDASFMLPMLINAELSFCDSEGNTVNSAVAADKLNAVINVSSIESSDKTLDAYVALYDGAELKKLVKQKVIATKMTDNENQLISLDLDDDITLTSKISLMLWDDELVPVSKAKSIYYTDNLIDSGSGDFASLYLNVQSRNLSAVTLVKDNFTVTSLSGEDIPVQGVTYYSHTGILKIEIPEDTPAGICRVTSCGLVSIDGQQVMIDEDVGTTRDYKLPMYETSLVGVDLLRKGMAVKEPDEDNDYIVRLRIVNQSDSAKDKFIIYRRGASSLKEAYEIDISDYSDINVEILFPIKLEKGDMISVAHIK